jgi:hypothetical protein
MLLGKMDYVSLRVKIDEAVHSIYGRIAGYILIFAVVTVLIFLILMGIHTYTRW